MRYLSTFSGIEAATVAWHPLGWEPVGFSEIEPFPSAVLKHHYPQVQNYGDITQFGSWSVEPFRLLVGGSPCQSFSVAGLRKGLADERGNLMLTFGKLAEHYRPTWVVWENVPGVLSSNGGRDFGTFLGMLAEFGYGFAYRVLDAQYFGVAQRRRRVFVVAHLGDWRPAAAVLFDPHSLSGHPAPRREKGKGIAGGFADGIGGGSHWDNGVNPHPTLNQSRNIGGIGMSNQEIFSQRGGGLAPHAIGFDSYNQCLTGDVSITISSAATDISHTGGVLVPHAFKLRGGCDGGGKGYLGQDECAFTLSTHQDRHLAQPIAMINMQGSKSNAVAQEDGPSYTLNAMHGHDVHVIAQPITYDIEQVTAQLNRQSRTPGDPCHTLAKGNTGNAAVVQPITYGIRDDVTPKFHEELSGTLGARDYKGPQSVITQYAVRRLTPIECERLQGFPDNYTAIPWRGKEASQCPDGPRYKALGNSMAVPVMRWIGERIQAVDDMLKELNR